MTRKEYMEFHRKICEVMVQIAEKKNHDYAGTGDDPFKNFRGPEFRGYASVEQGFLTRMDDKFARLSTWVARGSLEVADESVNDTLIDLANYCILMLGYIISKRSGDVVERSDQAKPARAL